MTEKGKEERVLIVIGEKAEATHSLYRADGAKSIGSSPHIRGSAGTVGGSWPQIRD